jgi:hypothetical protein
VKLQLQTTIENHPQTRFFACTRWIFRFLMVGHRGMPLFMRLYCMSLTPACEAYLGNMGLVSVQHTFETEFPFLEVFSGMGFYVRPHLLSSLPGEEIAFACFWFCG